MDENLKVNYEIGKIGDGDLYECLVCVYTNVVYMYIYIWKGAYVCFLRVDIVRVYILIHAYILYLPASHDENSQTVFD